MIPLIHDFTGQRVLVFGGGPVGARKARRFAREARTVVISPAFADRSFGDAQLVRAAPSADDVDGWIDRANPALVVAATDDTAVNDAVERAARRVGSLYVRADRSSGTDSTADPQRVRTPATVTDGPVVVSVSTSGRAPAVSRELRRRIEPEIDGAGRLAETVADLRAELKRTTPPDERRGALRAVVQSPAVWKGLRTGKSNDSEEARRIVDRYV